MRKTLSLLAIIATLALCSCGDDEENYGFIKNATFDTSLMFGRWDVEYMDEPNGSSYWAELKDIRMTFGKDGTFNIKYSTNNYEEYEITAKYTVEGDVITLDLDPAVTITLVRLDEYDIYFWISYFSDGNKYGVYCKGEKR